MGRFFPFILNPSIPMHLALDLDPASNSRVIAILEKDGQPLREAYSSFEEFLEDVIRANETNEHLACAKTPGNPFDLPIPELKPRRAKSGKKQIPPTENAFALRTDFSDDAAWNTLCKTIENNDDELAPPVDLIDDPDFAGVTAKQLRSHLPEDSSHTFAAIIDQTTLTHPEHPMLVVDLQDKPGRSFRAALAAFGMINSNLSIANMDFEDFASAVDKDGIFRGFPEM
jgi:hypothetical protein